jgi:hypothetical protein
MTSFIVRRAEPKTVQEKLCGEDIEAFAYDRAVVSSCFTSIAVIYLTFVISKTSFTIMRIQRVRRATRRSPLGLQEHQDPTPIHTDGSTFTSCKQVSVHFRDHPMLS